MNNLNTYHYYPAVMNRNFTIGNRYSSQPWAIVRAENPEDAWAKTNHTNEGVAFTGNWFDRPECEKMVEFPLSSVCVGDVYQLVSENGLKGPIYRVESFGFKEIPPSEFLAKQVENPIAEFLHDAKYEMQEKFRLAESKIWKESKEE